MDTAILTAAAAVLGSLAGGSASIATAWLTQRTQGRRQSIQVETRKRELLYAEFITECSKLVLDSLDHNLDRPETLLQAYSLVNRIRLTSCDAVLHEAEAAMQEILATYRAPNLPIEKLREVASTQFHDPLKAFAEASRNELQSLQQGAL
ncbi:MAG: hypothetical protein WAU32_01055 [Thermoanaerobaculia bacterium]